ncbi:MAG: hypothetical protein R3F50_05505 [Gammaproteobacteria bacterium]
MAGVEGLVLTSWPFFRVISIEQWPPNTWRRLPWATGKHQLTETYAWFLAGWASRLSWKEVAETFRTTWDHVFSSVEMAVAWGRAHQDLSAIEAIDVDEIVWQRGHRF